MGRELFDVLMTYLHVKKRTSARGTTEARRGSWKVAHLALPTRVDEHGRLDRVSLTLSAVLFLSPWLMGFSDMGLSAKTAWISASIIAIVSLAATLHFAEWEEWLNLLGAAWLIAAPWLLHFQYDGDAVAAFTACGAIIGAIAVSELWETHHPGVQPFGGPY